MKIFKKTEQGQGLVEYALILVLVAVVVTVILSLLKEQIASAWQSLVCDSLQLSIELCL